MFLLNLCQSLKPVFAFFYRSYIFTIRNLFTFFEIVFFPFVGVISVGLLSRFISLDSKVQSFILIGAITSGVLQVTQLDVSYGLLYDVWSKSIKQTFLAPVTIYESIAGSFLFGVIRGTIVFGLLSVFSSLLFDFYLPRLQVVIVFLLGVFLFGLLIGMIVNLSILLYGQRIDIIAWSLSIIAMLLCGIYYPINILPSGLAMISCLIPLTYFLEYVRTPYGFSSHFDNPLAHGFLLLMLYIILCLISLHLAIKKGKKTGTFLRMSE